MNIRTSLKYIIIWIKKILHFSYKTLQDDNHSQDDEPFNVYLERTKKIVKKTRNLKNIYIENNLLFKVNNKMI